MMLLTLPNCPCIGLLYLLENIYATVKAISLHCTRVAWFSYHSIKQIRWACDYDLEGLVLEKLMTDTIILKN